MPTADGNRAGRQLGHAVVTGDPGRADRRPTVLKHGIRCCWASVNLRRVIGADTRARPVVNDIRVTPADQPPMRLRAGITAFGLIDAAPDGAVAGSPG
jgi:hypothetical protein